MERPWPHLRALGFTWPALGAPPTSVTFGWPGAPALDAATFVEVHRLDQPRILPHDG